MSDIWSLTLQNNCDKGNSIRCTGVLKQSTLPQWINMKLFSVLEHLSRTQFSIEYYFVRNSKNISVVLGARVFFLYQKMAKF